MCRHLAYVGPPVTPVDWLLDAPNSLLRQSWAPQRQTHGVVNADGFGLGWYPTAEAEPIRHRGATPVWQDETFAELARSQPASCLLASVRSATAGTGFGAAAAMPFRHGRFLFSHNGALAGWPEAAAPLAAGLDVVRLLRLDAPTDAALLWALVAEMLDRGVPPVKAVADVVRRALGSCGGRLNLLVTDGRQVVATAAGASLAVRADVHGDAGGALVASEPVDDHPGWREVPDGHLVHATARDLVVTAL